ncbi:MAG: hypothetical protein H0X37_12630 [Herpetosiphonaceae bacterium]|nr:hypothetical protein [Herpetosiphonaceae bacterium]
MERVKTTHDQPEGMGMPSGDKGQRPFHPRRHGEDDLRFLDTLTTLLTQILPTLPTPRQVETAAAVCDLARVSPD